MRGFLPRFLISLLKPSMACAIRRFARLWLAPYAAFGAAMACAIRRFCRGYGLRHTPLLPRLWLAPYAAFAAAMACAIRRLCLVLGARQRADDVANADHAAV